MNLGTLLGRGLRHHARTHLGVVGGGAVAAATLVGALVVGDSVRFSLARHAALRIGRVDAALSAHDRFFTQELARGIEGELPRTRSAAVLKLGAVASRSDGGARAHEVQVLGVDADFFALAPGAEAPELPAINGRLATGLRWRSGEEIVLRIEKPTGIPGDMALAVEEDTTAPLRVAPVAIATEGEFGRFSLSAGQLPPATVFVERSVLQEALELGPRANLLLADLDDGVATGELQEALRDCWSLADAELSIRESGDALELVSGRIFLEEAVVEAAASLERPLMGVTTYFVNRLAVGERSIPYSMVSALVAMESASGTDGADRLGAFAVVPRDLAADEIVLNDWAAKDLAAVAGDELTLSWFGIGPARKLVERQRTLGVRGSVPIEGLAADRSLMPPFPGLHDAENCRAWEPGLPVDLDRIRDRDEAYWEDYRGTPKAFVSAQAAREMWSSRFGWLTAIRTPGRDGERFAAGLLGVLDPQDVGLFFRDVRTPAQASGTSATDFGGLFIGLSVFLISAALLLTGLLFVFGFESRSSEVGLYLALGFPPPRVRRLFLFEALVLAAIGSGIGSCLGLAYTQAVLRGLDTLWRGAVGRATLFFHVEPLTVAIGALSAFVVSTLAMLFTLRRLSKGSAVGLLFSRPGDGALWESDGRGGVPDRRRSRVLIGALLIGALVLVVRVDPRAGLAAAGAFFGAGTLVLTAGLVWTRLFLSRPRSALEDPRTLARLGVKNARRRAGRSLSVCALMAIGTFLVCGIGVYRQGATPQDAGRASGTGGFAFFARASVPVLADLTVEAGREAFGLQEELVAGVSFVPLRVRDGDEASCLNLARPQEPRLMGVDPGKLLRRGAFSFADTIEELEEPWSLLERELSNVGGERVVAAIGDVTSLTWTLKKKVGDELKYTDERGRPFRLRIVAALSDSILQGDLIIAEERFEELYPSESGYRAFLIDAESGGPAERRAAGRELSRGLADVGFALEPAGRRLDDFHAVQNTYLSIFQLLGGLGILLGSAGLGMVVLRNALERRGELALARALGFSPASIRWWMASEYGFLLLLGLFTGAGAAAVAIVPALRGAGPELATGAMALLLCAVAANGLVWILFATRAAVRSAGFAALREQ
ncbi:MAG: hypothetical protein CMJ89_15335 [Planctomycetes bacterium]|nr:hypothetical protein [Planctomycetota bacterium]